MFGWLFDPVKKLEKQYARKLAEAEQAMNKKGDRALHAKLTVEAEELGRELDALRAERSAS